MSFVSLRTSSLTLATEVGEAPAGLTEFWIIAGYLLLLILLGFFASRLFTGTKSDYQLASHSIGPFLLLMSIFGTTMTAFALLGSTGEAYKEGIGVYGMLASSSGIIHSLCFFLVGIRLWSFGKRYGYATQIQFFRDRLDSDLIGLLLFPILVSLVIPYLLIGVMGSGTVIQTMTAGAFPDVQRFVTESPATSGGFPKEFGSLVVCCVVLSYVFFGGMRGTAWANAFQTIVFMVLGVVTFCVIASRLGGEESLLDNLRKLGEAIPEDKATRVEMSKTKFFSYLLIPLSVGMFPHLFQHWLTAKSAKSFRLSVVAHPLFIMIVWVPCVLIGVWATSDLIPANIPLPKNPNAVLTVLVKNLTGPILGGLLTAGVLAAIMSSLDSQFLCIGTMFTNDIATHYAKEGRFTDRQEVMLTRGFIIAIVALTYWLSLFESKSVFTLGVWCFTGFASLFPLVVAAVYWRGLTKHGAFACVLATIGAWLYFFREAGYGANRTYTIDLLGHEVMPVAAIFAMSAIALVGVSLVTSPPKEETLRKFFSDDII
ncbi:sodium:solute symporter family protein [Adhaeretor mobilis]|uniref:Sodium/proline symporter n=1 Tax=Adhaeretor mobilis TaxID=1930276 RepID=A0A517N1Z3_9BACT|nr:sodium:solute symporter family protein [Adhaeretor mobilis]QDT01153.1 Sodium/proline symporter [Adhaeretor mobilis]